MRGNPASAPKSAAERVVGEVSPRANRYDSLSTSKLRHTATRALPGQDFGVIFCPPRAGATARRSCSSVQCVPGWAGGPCSWATTEAANKMPSACARLRDMAVIDLSSHVTEPCHEAIPDSFLLPVSSY